MLPILLDIIDEIYNALDNQSRAPSHIPLLFLPQRPSAAAGCGKGMPCKRGPIMGRFKHAGEKWCGKGIAELYLTNSSLHLMLSRSDPKKSKSRLRNVKL